MLLICGQLIRNIFTRLLLGVLADAGGSGLSQVGGIPALAGVANGKVFLKTQASLI